uniref:Uncharacterized protein n=1 Tax=Kalanchoe fedtschenkoi TaxID=63787 RepID=A0A7N0UHC9_KALFE
MLEGEIVQELELTLLWLDSLYDNSLLLDMMVLVLTPYLSYALWATESPLSYVLLARIAFSWKNIFGCCGRVYGRSLLIMLSFVKLCNLCY